VLIVGDRSVGKTSYVQRYVQNTFTENYKGTVGVDFAVKVLKLSDTTVTLQLWDIAGEKYEKQCRKINIKLVCFVYFLTTLCDLLFNFFLEYYFLISHIQIRLTSLY
jgi:small GTP-binding protein